MPGMKAVGTKTDDRTSAIPMTGPESSSIAFRAASFGLRPLSMCRWTPSTTTIASSTTSPMASTSPNIDSVFDRETEQRKEGERADERDGHCEQRDERGSPVLEEDETTTMTSTTAMKS